MTLGTARLPPPTISVSDVSAQEGNTDTIQVIFAVSLSRAEDRTVSVHFSTADGTAFASTDYVPVEGTLSFAPGSTRKTFAVSIIGDSVFEYDEIFYVRLSQPQFGELLDSEAIGSIINDDLKPSISISGFSIPEGNSGISTANFTLSLSQGAGVPVTIEFQLTDETAIAPQDYNTQSGSITFAPGSKTRNLPIEIKGDLVYELDETFVVNLINPGNATLANSKGIGTILNDDLSPIISISGISIWEGNIGYSIASFSITLSQPSAVPATVHYNTVDVSATSGSDYQSASGMLTLAAGTTRAEIRIPVIGDTVFEADETFTILLSNPNHSSILDPQGTGTIVNDDAPPALSISDVSMLEGNTGSTQMLFEVSLSKKSELPVSVQFSTRDGTATSGQDFSPISGTLIFNPTTPTQTISVSVEGDILYESDEIFNIDLSNATNATVPMPFGVGTILNDDTPPILSISDVVLKEGDSGTIVAEFTLALSKMVGATVSVEYATADISAAAGFDYQSSSSTVSFPPGTTTKTISILVNGDTLYELDEQFAVNLKNPANATLADAEGIGTITNDDIAPTLSVSDASVIEGNTGTIAAEFTLTLSKIVGATVSVEYATADISTTAGFDYQSSSGTVSFPPGTTTKTASVLVNGDTLYELDEQFVVNLKNPTNATLTDAQAIGTITNDDIAPTLSVSDASVIEGNTGTIAAEFTLTLSKIVGATVSVEYATADISTTAGFDYQSSSGTASFPPGTTTKTVSVLVSGDTLYESDEQFAVNLKNPTNATLTDAQGIGTILNDDAMPSLFISDVSVFEGNNGITKAMITVSLSNTSGLVAKVQFSTANSTALAGSDYNTNSGAVFFQPGITSQTISVPIIGDTLFEPDESFALNLTTPTNATVSDSQAIVSILNDDAMPSLSISDVSILEGNVTGDDDPPPNPVALFTVSLSQVSSIEAKVLFSTADIIATAGSDYVATSGILIFPPGTITQTILVTVNRDNLFELNETFAVNLTKPTSATIADGQGIGTILNDDSMPSLFISNVSVNEANSGNSNALFSVTLSKIVGTTIQVDFATADISATAGSDYSARSGTLSFAPGITIQNISVPIMGDTLYEFNESFAVNLTNPVNTTLLNAQGIGTITNDDAIPSLSISNVTITEKDGASTDAIFTVTLSAPSGLIASVNFGTADISAMTGVDYTAKSGNVSFSPGTTIQTISVPVLGDTLFELDESFAVNLTTPTNATILDAQAIGTITNDDPIQSLTISDISIPEGNSASSNAIFTVTLSQAVGTPVSVNFSTADLSATAGADYTASSGTLTFPIGTTSKTISVPIVGETLFEPNESFAVNLSNPISATIVVAQAIGTITNDDAMSAISISSVSIQEGSVGSTNAVFTVSLSKPSGLTVNMDFATADISATAGADYTATSGSLTFAPGITSKTILVPVLGDALFENNETFAVNLSNPSNATFTNSQGIGTITNDDSMPTLSIANVFVTEGNTGSINAIFNVSLSKPSGLPVSVDYTTKDATAIGGLDYSAVSGSLNFPPLSTTQTISVPVQGDALYEFDENFIVELSNVSNAFLPAPQAIGTILNDDALPSLTILDLVVIEPNAGVTNALLTVNLSQPAGTTVSVNFATANISATAPADYTSTSGTLSFAPGTTTQNIAVSIIGDTLFEPDESFALNLTTPTNATVFDSQAIVTLLNDDAMPSISISDVSILEGNSLTTNAVFTISLSQASGLSASVQFSTTDISASAGVDYISKSGTVSFPAGSAVQSITVVVSGDTLYEANEMFAVNLSNASGATILASQGIGTILNDDASPVLSIADRIVTEGDSGNQMMIFMVTLSKPSSLFTSVQFGTVDSSAVAGSDYNALIGTLLFVPGNIQQIITVDIFGDLAFESNETFLVNLSNPVNAIFADNSAIGTIVNNDPPLAISISDSSVTEGHSGNVFAIFNLTLSSANSVPVSVQYSTANGSGFAGYDYVTSSGSVTITAGSTTGSIQIPVIGDLEPEFNETFLVNLNTPTNAVISDGQGVGTIIDDEPKIFLQTDLFSGDGQRADFLFVLDDSSSMQKRIQELVDNSVEFIRRLNSRREVSWQAAVTVPDIRWLIERNNGKMLIQNNGNKGPISVVKSKTTPDPVATLQSILQAVVDDVSASHDTQRGWDASKFAIELHGREFQRPAEPTNIVILSDEDDASCNQFVVSCSKSSTTPFSNFFKSQVPRPLLYPIVDISSNDNCSSERVGDRYMAVQMAVGTGSIFSICDSTNAYLNIADKLSSRGECYQLSKTPTGNFISVFIDGTKISQGIGGYSIQIDTNAICFDNLVPIGSQIVVSYEAVP